MGEGAPRVESKETKESAGVKRFRQLYEETHPHHGLRKPYLDEERARLGQLVEAAGGKVRGVKKAGEDPEKTALNRIYRMVMFNAKREMDALASMIPPDELEKIKREVDKSIVEQNK